jgi:NADH-quinone oxidoreductase subunit N
MSDVQKYLGDWTLAAPELTLAGGAMLLLVMAVFRGDKALRAVTYATVIFYALAIAFTIGLPSERLTAFSDLFVVDPFARFLKVVILAGAAASAVLAVPYLTRQAIGRFEYPLLILLASVGMCMMVSSNDLISLYVGLELQSLALYVLASVHRDDIKSTEAGLKYFVLGALSSGLLLYGCSLLYGFGGTTNFEGLRGALATAQGTAPHLGVLFGLIFVIAGLAFKISAVPFHMWTPDVYEGSPTPVTAFFAAAPKVAAIGLLLRVMFDAFGGLVHEWQQIIILISAASMLVGAVAALAQTNIKRLLAFSSIGHVGYALIGLACGTQAGVKAVLIYMAIYLVTTIASFLCVMAMRRDALGPVEEIDTLSGLARHNTQLAVAFTVVMFSLAGIPPLVGFFGKYYIFQAAMATNSSALTYLAIWGVISSVIGAAYYIRIVKVIWFDAPREPLSPTNDLANNVMLAGTTLLVSPLGLLFLAPLAAAAAFAASSLIAG